MTDPSDLHVPAPALASLHPGESLPVATMPLAAGVNSSRPRGWRTFAPVAPYVAVLGLTLLIAALILQVWHLDLQAPLAYEGDGMLHLMFTKAFVENGWYFSNPFLAAPSGMEIYEFPAADTLPGLMLKGLGLFTHEPALLNNLLYLLTYPLTSLTAFFVCRRLGIRMGLAAVASLLYAFLPYHFYRGTAHLYLSAYFVVPLAILVAWWIATGRLFEGGTKCRWPRTLFSAVLCGVISLAGVYYPFFSGLILAAGCLYALTVRRDWRSFLLGGALGAVLVGGLLVCLSPTLLYLRAHPRRAASQRAPGETEIYGLKIAQLVLPLDGHRLPALAAIKTHYNEGTPLTNENTSSTLGFAGAGGFLLLVGWLLFRPIVGRGTAAASGVNESPVAAGREIFDVFGVFNGTMVLFGTIGGGASLFSHLVSPQVRSVNRISVFIAFLSLAALAAGLDAWSRRWPATLFWRLSGWSALTLLLVLGVLDQTTPADVGNYSAIRREYRADHNFFRKVEQSLPHGTMVFQLPYLPFPEAGGVYHLGDYDHFRGYVHTSDMRWSYGVIKGGVDDAWQATVGALPLSSAVQVLAARGFGGILLERDGYADDAMATEAELRQILGPPVAFRRRRLFFDLAAYTRALQASLTPEQWRSEQARAAHPLLPVFARGFSSQESNEERVWRWCGPRGEIAIKNDSAESRRVHLKMLVNTGRPEPAKLEMFTPNTSRTWTIDGDQRPIEESFDVPPGELSLRFACDGQPIDAPADPRVMVWSATDLELWEEDAGR